MGLLPNVSPLLVLLLGISTVNVNGFWFGSMEEPELLRRDANLKPRQACNTGSVDCGSAGCITSAACCNAAADCEFFLLFLS
jgi:hypothetical protein